MKNNSKLTSNIIYWGIMELIIGNVNGRTDYANNAYIHRATHLITNRTSSRPTMWATMDAIDEFSNEI